jgi:thioredoxin-like negative regulator of GroEL
MPSFVLFKNGERVDSMTGASEEKLKEVINKNYSS